MTQLNSSNKEPLINIVELTRLTESLKLINEEVKAIRQSMLGSFSHPGGMVKKLDLLEKDVCIIKGKVNKVESEVQEIKLWVNATKNRAVGVGIGITLGGAGLGAGFITLISKLFGS